MRFPKLNPTIQIVLTFLLLILIGSVALYFFGFSTDSPNKTILNTIFTSTSAVCVTGLSTIDVSKDLSFQGQLILLLLIQLGGLGILTLSNWFVMNLKGKLSFGQSSITNETYGQISGLSIDKVLQYVVIYTLTLEILGALFLFLFIYRDYSLLNGFWIALFHSISAFCNAGFSLFPDSLTRYQNHVGVNAVIIFLIISGGLGFLVVADVFENIKSHFHKKRVRLLLHTKVVLITSAILIIFGSIIFLIFEWNHSFAGDHFARSLLKSLFLSVTSRTAGFNTIDTEGLSNISINLLMLLMVIGGASGSTAGGVKVNTAYIIYAIMRSTFYNHKNVEVFKRTLSQPIISKAILVVSFYFLVLFLSVATLEFMVQPDINQPNMRGIFLDHVFEVISALSTVGLSLGTTQRLDAYGQFVLIICMFAGRLGPLTLAISLFGVSKQSPYSFPNEDIMVG